MPFQTPITIKSALEAIQQQEYVLPAIQREFIWSQEQIASLFDSLMQGYPIGSFLFWKVDAERSKDYTWYGFMRDYHRKRNAHLPELDLPVRPLLATLDGQQRLTSLNIGLRGSHAEKEPRKWWSSPDAFPVKKLYLNLLSPASENELGLKYDFRFLSPKRAADERDEHTQWFHVADVFGFDRGFEVIRALQGLGLAQDEVAAELLDRLYSVVHRDALIPYFLEEEQNLDKVLNIFIRVNSGGTPLSYSDLLLSIATAQWRDIDARQAIHNLVDELNETGHGFRFSKDLVLKAGLMLAEIPSVAFRVTNFNAANMGTLEAKWPQIEAALRSTVRLLADFGFSWQTLSADSIVIPIAYYLYKRGDASAYVEARAQKGDRDSLRKWVFRTLMKAGVWGSGLDTTLVAIRGAIRDSRAPGFPVDEVESAMARTGKVLRFTEEEIQDLLDSVYGDKRTFVILAVLYPFVDLSNPFHVDHVFPTAQMTRARLLQAGVPEESISEFRDMAKQLPNLQLLDGSVNMGKGDKLSFDWLAEEYGDERTRKSFMDRHDLHELPNAVPGFPVFHAVRRERMAARLRKSLGLWTEA